MQAYFCVGAGVNLTFYLLLLDVRSLVQEYLNCPRVIRKNGDGKTFEAPLKVFVDLVQTASLTQPENVGAFNALQHEYNMLCEKKPRISTR